MIGLRLAFGALLAFALIAAAYLYSGGAPQPLLQPVALAGTVGATFGVLVMGFPFRFHLKAFRLALAKTPGPKRELMIARHYFTTMGLSFVLFGVVLLVFGVINVMENLDKPERIGPGLGAAFCGLAYGALLKLLVANGLQDAVTEKLALQAIPAATAAPEAAKTKPAKRPAA